MSLDKDVYDQQNYQEIRTIINIQMQKTLTIKTISFKEQKSRKQASPLHSTCRLSRSEIVTTERQYLDSKIIKGLSEKINCIRLDNITPQRTSINNNKKSFQNSNSECKKRENRAKHRYQNLESGDINQSAINYKLSSHHFHPASSFNQPSKKKAKYPKDPKRGLDETIQLRKYRVKSQPNNSTDLKKQLMTKVSKKLQLLRKMTIQSEAQAIHPIHYKGTSSKAKQSSNLFDKIYDHCLKKLNKNIALYEKNLTKSKDQKYFELKFENSVLTKELIEIRKDILKKVEDAENQSNMGIVGNVIDFSKTTQNFKINRKKISIGYCEKKNSKSKLQGNFLAADTRGWEAGEKHDQFYLCS